MELPNKGGRDTGGGVLVKPWPPPPDPWPLFLRYAGFLFLFEEGHHGAQLAADFFDGLMAGGFAHGEEILAAGLVLVDPFLGELAGLNLREDLAHFGARLFVHDAGAARVIAVLGGVRDGESHVAEAAF